MTSDQRNNAAYFDGTMSNYIICNPFNSFPKKEITVELWISSNDQQKYGSPFSYAVPSGDNEFLLYDSKKLEIDIKNELKVSGISYNDGLWHHCAATWRSDTGEVTLFKDGQKVFSTIMAKGKTLDNGGSLVLGQDQDKVGGAFDVNQAFKGWMREVRIWDKIRSPEEIRGDMGRSLTGKESGLVAYYPLSESTSNLVKDQTGNGNDAAVYGILFQQPPELPPIEPASFDVPGDSPNGYEFTNTRNVATSYTFTASETWSPDKQNPNLQGCTAEGLPSFNSYVQDGIKQAWPSVKSDMKYPQTTPFVLIAQNTKTGEVIEVGEKATIVLKPGENLRFVLNDAVWNYDNNSGSIKVDWSGVSLVSKVMQFNGDGNYITLSPINVNLAEGLTIEAWVWYDAFQYWSRIIDLGNGERSDNIIFANALTDTKLALSIYKGGSGHDFPSPSGVLEQGKWLHLAMTLDPAGNAVLYKNGDPVAASKVPFPNNINRTKNYIGKSNWSCDKDFKGKMAEVRFWNRVRTPAEIQADMLKRLTGKESGLVGYWPLNEVRVEGSEIKVADFTGNFPATVTGTFLVQDRAFPLT
jgi:Pentaxin family/Concanavalin A-like lectin/glucanases superfamily